MGPFYSSFEASCSMRSVADVWDSGQTMPIAGDFIKRSQALMCSARMLASCMLVQSCFALSQHM